MQTWEYELEGYNTKNGRPVLTVKIELDDDDNYVISSHSVTDGIQLNETEAKAIVDADMKKRGW